jgi:excisionase family DNA binding protein
MDRPATDRTADHDVSGTPDTWPLSARDAAALLGVNERTIRRAIARGDLPAARQGGVYRIAAADLDHYRTGRQHTTSRAVSPRRDPPRLIPFPGKDRAITPTLPRPLTTLIGREREIADLRALLLHSDVPLLTLTGAGGVGKTRLALATAAEAAPDFPDGTVFVSLVALTDPALVLPTIAQALGVREGGLAIVERLGALLGDKRLLLVLDNLEHLTEATPQLVELLSACPQLTILATSRVVLRLSGEQVYPVMPLDLPDAIRPCSLDDLAQSESINLFVQRARAAEPTFVLTPDNAPAVAEIVRRLDGLPLAIELAAARVRSLSPSALLARLSDRLWMLTGGARDLPARQRTMRDTIAWSHDLLDEAGQTLFRRLAVFAGGFTLDAAESVVAGTGNGERGTGREPLSVPSIVEGIGALVDQSMLQRMPGPTGESRYLMLETVREFARERLEANGEAESVHERHAGYFADLAEAIAPYLQWQPDAAGSIARLDAELDNLRAALVWSSARDTLATFLRLAVALESFWTLRGRLAEGRMWLDRALGVCDTAPVPLRAAVVRAAAWIGRHQCDYDRAEELGAAGLALSLAHGDALAVVHALTLLGWVADEQGQFARAQAYHEEALVLGRSLTDKGWSAWSMRNIGKQIFLSGDPETAELWFEEAFAIFRRDGIRHGAAVTLHNLGEIALWRGECAQAALFRREWLELEWDAQGLGYCLLALAEVAVVCGEMERAARLLGAAEVHRARLGVTLLPRQVADYDRQVTAARQALGEAVFAAVWTEGRRLSPEEARAEAFRVIDALQESADRAAPAPQAIPALTPRELEILQLVTTGWTNREVADALFISVATVKRHLTTILRKLGLATRSAAAEYARAHKLA